MPERVPPSLSTTWPDLQSVAERPYNEGDMLAHTFRLADGLNHLVVNARNRTRRNGRHHTLCAQRVNADAQRTTSRAATTCDPCLTSFTGLVDVLDTDFGFATHDDGTGRFATKGDK